MLQVLKEQFFVRLVAKCQRLGPKCDRLCIRVTLPGGIDTKKGNECVLNQINIRSVRRCELSADKAFDYTCNKAFYQQSLYLHT